MESKKPRTNSNQNTYEYLKQYYRTIKGISNKLYFAQKCNAKKRGMDLPNYSLKEFRVWLYSQESFPIIYDEWVKSGYKRDITPSADRIDNKKSYLLSNLQLITWLENREKGYLENADRSGVSVSQYDKKHNLIRVYKSSRFASRETGVDNSHIIKCCKGKYKTSGGYIWEYKDMGDK